MADERDEMLANQQDSGEGPEAVETESTTVDGDQDSGSEASGEAVESLRELVTYLVNSLADEPETVEIDVSRRGPAVHIQLRLPEGELGKVIGRGGRIAKAMRTVLLIAGSKHHLRVSLDIES
jgi:predicted RNA-binding protein YlqC (UPF0109 family)